jgi:hypothetical protein
MYFFKALCAPSATVKEITDFKKLLSYVMKDFSCATSSRNFRHGLSFFFFFLHVGLIFPVSQMRRFGGKSDFPEITQ